jgi:hypothetical protein
MTRGRFGLTTERTDELVLALAREEVVIDCAVDPRARNEDALAFVADAERCDAPHAAQAKSTHAIPAADRPRLEVRGRAPTGQSLADDPG